MTAFNLALAIAGGTMLVLGLAGGYVTNRLWIAETTISLAVGILVGPAVLGFMEPDAIGWKPNPELLEVARVTLGIAVMGAALRLPPGYASRQAHNLGVSLGLGLTLMWLTASALAVLILGLPVLSALLVGAVLAPTDPVVASSIASGKTSEEYLPSALRDLLTAESAANDGLALLFLLLPILLLDRPVSAALADWLMRVLLWEVLGAVAIGAVAGSLSGRLLLWAYRQPFSERHSTITVALALSITVLSLVLLIGME